MTLTARNITFEKNTLSSSAGSTVVIMFNNMYSGVRHNFTLSTDTRAATRIFAGKMGDGLRITIATG